MTARASVYVTRNFERNLEDIRAFLAERDEAENPNAFERLLDTLFETVIPNLEQFPRLGVDFLARKPQGIDGTTKLRAIQSRLGPGGSVREYILNDYIILYAVGKARIDLLAIKHHRQLSFDLRGHWVP